MIDKNEACCIIMLIQSSNTNLAETAFICMKTDAIKTRVRDRIPIIWKLCYYLCVLEEQL